MSQVLGIFIPVLSLFFLCVLNQYFVPSRVFAVSYACPLNTSNITGVMQWNDGWPLSEYGRASHGILPIYQPTDINGFYGSSVLSPTRGVVTNINPGNPDMGGGEEIVILGDDNQYYAIAHIRNRRVNQGDRVETNQQIGNLVTQAETVAEGRFCNLNNEFTAPFGQCNKIHIHFDVYRGAYENPTSASTLSFVSTYCGINRPLGDTNPEFPQLPTLNCAKITRNPNIELCFMQKTISLSAGWNKIIWSSIRGNMLGLLPSSCFVVKEDKKIFVRNFSPINLTLDDNKIYFIACRESTDWGL